MLFESAKMLKRLPEQFFAQLVQKAQQLQDEGYDVINLGQGNPDLPTPDVIVRALQQAAANPVNHQYSPFRGFSYVKKAVANFYRRHYNVKLDPEKEVAVLFGSKAGLVEVCQCLLNHGDMALLPDPGYPDYLSGVAMADATPVMMPLKPENHFLPDYSIFTRDQLRKAKLMFLNYPNNPTASIATKEFFDNTITMAKENEICVVHDFAYGAIGFDGKKPRSFMQSDGAKDVGIELYTLSKTYNMAGWRVAFAVGNPSVIEHINLLQDHLYCSLFGGIQYAAKVALDSDISIIQELVTTYENRRNVFIQSLRKIGWKVEQPAGTFYAWLKVPDGFTSGTFSDFLLEEAHIVVAPGHGFGMMGEGYVRIGLVAPEERLVEAAQRIGMLDIFSSSYKDRGE